MQALKSMVPKLSSKGETAIVTGATGMLGREIVLELARQGYTKIHSLSRSKKGELPANTVHHHLDLSSSAEEMAEVFKREKIEGSHLFFSAYLERPTEEEACQVNGALLENFLRALELSGGISKLKRIILVIGGKIYGVHLGRVKVPMQETDALLPEPPYPRNFYTVQIRILEKFCEKHNHITWVGTLPNDVIGFVQGNFMNLITSVALYAAVCRELGAPFIFPGSPRFYDGFDCFTGSRLHAEFCLWAASEPSIQSGTFNIHNGDTESWSNLWPRIAKRFGLTIPADQFTREVDSAYSDFTLFESPPINTDADARGLGKQPANKVERRVELAKWAQKPEVKQAWTQLAERNGLDKTEFEKATWNFTNFVLGRNYDLVISMSKARKHGWTGYQDTWENIECVLTELENANVIPKYSKTQ